MAELFAEIERRVRLGLNVTRKNILALSSAVEAGRDKHGRASAELQLLFLSLSARVREAMTPGARVAFQRLAAECGARIKGPIVMPESDTPFWQMGSHPLAGFRSSSRLPPSADVVIIGAGLTGASTALHLAPQVRKKDLRVVVLDAGDPATQASGRNGGNFELIPENFLGDYQGLPAERRKWLARRYPWLSAKTIADAADVQTRTIFEFGSRNSRRLIEIVERESIDCDLSLAGWVRIADSKIEERGIREEVEYAARLGIRLDLLSPDQIFRETGIRAKHAGRKAAANGNYHPFKFVCGVLERAIRKGVQLYAGTPAVGFRPAPDGRIRLETSRGRIEARRVVFATNAFTSTLLPELTAIRYHQSQILNLEHVLDTIRGMTITEKKGDLYYNFPASRRYVDPHGTRRGMLHAGGGLDRSGKDPNQLRRSSVVLDLVLDQVFERFPETRGQPPSRLWTGPMAFTPDRIPVIGFLKRKGFSPDSLIVAAGFNGYGGTYCVETGRLAAEMAQSGLTPAEIPEHMFSPHRFFTRRPLF